MAPIAPSTGRLLWGKPNGTKVSAIGFEEDRLESPRCARFGVSDLGWSQVNTSVWSLVAVVAIGVSTSQGMLLEVGSRLEYQVWRGFQSDSTHTRLTILGRAVTDSGARWTIGIHDSALSGGAVRLDTAILRNKDGRLVWDRPSCLAGWDPEPTLPPSFAGYYGLDPKTLMGGGVLAGACYAWDSSVVRSQGWGVPPGLKWVEGNGLSRAFLWQGTDGIRHDLPLGIHVRDTGWARIRDTVSKEDWRLISLDGKTLPASWTERFASRLTVELAAGTRWVWIVRDQEDSSSKWSRGYSRADSFKVAWRVLEELADSAGWIRRTFAVESERDSLDDDSMALRINLEAGIVRISHPSGILYRMAEGFVRFWYDKELPGGDYRRNMSVSREAMSWAKDSLVVTGREGVGLLGLRSRRASGNQMQGSTSRTLEVALESKDGESVRVTRGRMSRELSTVAWVPSETFLRELERRPSSSIRILQANGGITTRVASEALPTLRSFRGMAILEIRDGVERIRCRMVRP